MNKEILFGQIRHVVTILASGMTVHGYTVTGSDAEMIAGIVITVVTVLWSMLQKKGLAP